MKTHLFGAAALALSLSANAAFAQAPHAGGWHHEGMEFLRGVTLTDAQKEQIHTIAEASMPSMKPLMMQDHTLHEQYESALLAGATSTQLSGIISQEEALKTQMDTQRLNLDLQIRGVLTPDQLAQASATSAKLAALHEQEHQIAQGAGQ